MNRLFALIVSMLIAAGCGSEDSQGFLTDNNICKPNENLLAADTTAYNPSAYERLYGTLGGDARAAQEFNTTVKKELWGLQIFLQADVKPSQGLKVLISRPDADGGPGGESIAEGAITPGNIPAIPGWVPVQMDDIVTVEKSTNYWIKLTPNYPHSDANRAGWAVVSGSGLATYSIETSLWTRVAGSQALYRFIECQ